ncbi:hypothetical protein QN328_09080 [Streptococcus agalactiae]|uniref:hypothetical protein n=1 Tax=Streptococcus agalactiae TaxID=1311 RepID=UPI00397ABC14
MKDLVISFAQDYLSWGAVGLGVGIGVFMLAKEKSTGKSDVLVFWLFDLCFYLCFSRFVPK